MTVSYFEMRNVFKQIKHEFKNYSTKNITVSYDVSSKSAQY